MLLRWLYYWSLLLEVWQRSVSCCWGGYITDHYCLRFDRGVFHVAEVVILLTITIWALTGEWFMLLRWLYYLPLLFEVWQRTVLCCWGGYIAEINVWSLIAECFMLLRCLYYWQLLYELWQGSGSCCWGGYITDHYCLRFDRGAVHAVEVTILLTITIWGLRDERLIISRWLYDWPLLYDNDTHLTLISYDTFWV
jgi:hypothetical protein